VPDLVDCLEFWHPTRDQPADEATLDWGVIARSSSADRLIRLRNLSTAYVASGVVVSVEELGVFEPARSIAAQHLLSLDGRRFQSTVELGDLAPRAVGPPITVRRVTAPDADYGLGEYQLLAHPTAWV
jgi:hypothetical protein